MESQIAVIMVPYPAQGHLNQLLHLSHFLASNKLQVHYTGSATHNRQAKLRIHGWDLESLNKIHFHDFDLPSFTSPSPDSNNTATRFPVHLQPIFEASVHLREPLCQLLYELAPKFRRIVVIHDSLMCSVVQDVKSIANAEAYNSVPFSTFYMFNTIWEKLSEKPFELDLNVVPTSIIPSDEGCLPPEFSKLADYQKKFMDFQSGMLYNTNRVIEGKYAQLMEKLSPDANVKHFFIGPYSPVEITVRKSEEKRHACFDWLDKQERNSVIYVSFGTMTTMSDEQIKELAEGLEMSGQKFIWVLRIADKCDIFVGGEEGKIQLPKGYETRVKNKGILVKDWAPQLEILAHGSIGGFMTHCGWNSSLESISSGVPVAAWPMHSDQPKNAFLLTNVLGIGTMVRDWVVKPEVVMSNVIENAVTKLMASDEGTSMRNEAKKLGEAVRESFAKGGACYTEREAFIAHITK